MHDQAFNLRALMMETAWARQDRCQRPRSWWITTGRQGAGTSTLAVNLAATLARKGRSVLVAMITEQPRDLELLCGLSDAHGSPVAALRQGPAGMLVLSAGSNAAGTQGMRFQQIGQALDKLHGCVELVIVDAGPRFGLADSVVWGPADTLLYVTTADDSAVVDTYAAIKQLVTQAAEPPKRIGILVNQTVDSRQGQRVFDRIAETCSRFLGIAVYLVGDVPYERSMAQSRPSLLPTVLQSPTSSVARAIEHAAVALTKQTQIR